MKMTPAKDRMLVLPRSPRVGAHLTITLHPGESGIETVAVFYYQAGDSLLYPSLDGCIPHELIETEAHIRRMSEAALRITINHGE